MDVDGEYEQRIKRLYDAKQQCHSMYSSLTRGSGSLIERILGFAKDYGLIASFEFNESILSGRVVKFDSSEVTIQVLEWNGEPVGISALRLDSVLSIAVDTDDEQDISLLNRLRIRE